MFIFLLGVYRHEVVLWCRRKWTAFGTELGQFTNSDIGEPLPVPVTCVYTGFPDTREVRMEWFYKIIACACACVSECVCVCVCEKELSNNIGLDIVWSDLCQRLTQARNFTVRMMPFPEEFVFKSRNEFA